MLFQWLRLFRRGLLNHFTYIHRTQIILLLKTLAHFYRITGRWTYLVLSGRLVTDAVCTYIDINSVTVKMFLFGRRWSLSLWITTVCNSFIHKHSTSQGWCALYTHIYKMLSTGVFVEHDNAFFSHPSLKRPLPKRI